MQNKRPSHHFVSCEIQIDNCYFMSYNIYNNVGNKKDQDFMDIEEKPSDTEWTPIAKISILCTPLL